MKRLAKLLKKPEVNIGLLGHVDHGKTTLTQAITGKWTDTHSEELKRGITIKLGYANACFFFEEEKGAPEGYNSEGRGKFLRCVSFVDAPGHEALMAVMLSGSAIMDGALLVIAANEGIRAQTKEHLMAAKIAGIQHFVVVQNKIDAVSKERALKSRKEIEEFLAKYGVEAPIIPISALHRVNIDLVIEAIERFIPTPKRDEKAPPKFIVVRSFDINKPGTPIEKLHGGVLGGALVQGKLKLGDEIEIRPGVKTPRGWEPVITEVRGLATEGLILKEATPGGSLAIETALDPAVTKNDGMMGNIVGKPGKMPEIFTEVEFEPVLFDHVVGFENEVIPVEPLKRGELLVVNVAAAVAVAQVTAAGDTVAVRFNRPVCIDSSTKLVLSRKVRGKWRLIGYGKPKL